MQKQKTSATHKNMASMNRTLSINLEDVAILRGRLTNTSSLKESHVFLNKTIHGNILDVLPLLPDGFADLVIIDPPYNKNKDFGEVFFKEQSDSEYETYIKSWLHDVCRKLKNNGSLYLCGDWKSAGMLQRLLGGELNILNRITWQREKGRGAKANWKNCTEDIWFAVKDVLNYYFDVDAVKMRRRVIAPYRVDGKPKDWEETLQGGIRNTCPSNFWDDITVPFWSMKENTKHPTQKSEKLYAKLILASCPASGVVFDPFLGSGTSSVVAKKLGRKWCGVEISEEYCLLAEKRLEMASTDTAIQGYNDGIFWERNSLAMQRKVLNTANDNCNEFMFV